MREIVSRRDLPDHHVARGRLGTPDIAEHQHVDQQHQKEPAIGRAIIGRAHRRAVQPRQEEQQQDRAEHRQHAEQLGRDADEIDREGAQDRVERPEIPFGHDVRGRLQRVGRDIIVGNGGSDELAGGDGDDLIIGDGELYGGNGNDILESRNMSDDNYDGRAFMFGGDGDDTYRFGMSSADTFVYNGSEGIHYQGYFHASGDGGSSSDFDVLEFMEGVSPDDINFYVNNYGLELEVGNNGYIVRLVDYFEPATYLGEGTGETAPIDEIRFADGTVWDQAYIEDAVSNITPPVEDQDIEGTDQADTLYGDSGDDWIEGYGGDDVLYGEDGDDVLVGGSGNDTLYGGDGEDDYDFYPGFGQDIIYNTSNDYNEIWLYEVAESDVAYAQQGNDLVVSIIGTSDQITVKDWYESAEHKVVVYFDSTI